MTSALGNSPNDCLVCACSKEMLSSTRWSRWSNPCSTACPASTGPSFGNVMASALGNSPNDCLVCACSKEMLSSTRWSRWSNPCSTACPASTGPSSRIATASACRTCSASSRIATASACRNVPQGGEAAARDQAAGPGLQAQAPHHHCAGICHQRPGAVAWQALRQQVLQVRFSAMKLEPCSAQPIF